MPPLGLMLTVKKSQRHQISPLSKTNGLSDFNSESSLGVEATERKLFEIEALLGTVGSISCNRHHESSSPPSSDSAST